MANLSKLRREKMLEFLQTLKEEHNDDASIIALNAIETALTDKKYGLVWEKHSEQVDDDLKTMIPVFSEVKERQVSNGEGNYNFLLEGDNLHSLYLLEKTHKEKIDVIYIDPPYNTGSRSWKYNNDYVEKEDNFRHSKFASFMTERLVSSKKLLSDNGIIICAIDDHEIATIRLIMDEIFGEDNRLGTVVVVHNPRGRNDSTFIATMHEYLLFYAKKSSDASIGYFPIQEKHLKQYNKSDDISRYNETSFIRTGNNSLRTERPGLWYKIFYNLGKDNLSLTNENEDDVTLLPINSKGEERCWRWGPETFEQFKDTELFVKIVKGEYKIFKKRRLTDAIGRKPRTVWTDSRYDASSNGIMLLKKLFDGENPFPYPKSLYSVSDAISITSKQDSIILDFFAGSGTTGHAVLKLNAEDGGSRKFILCTDNENNICEEVTYERLLRIQPDLPHNLKYFKTDYIPRFTVESAGDALIPHIRELVELENGISLSDPRFALILSEDEMDAFFDQNRYKACEMIYLSSDVLVTKEQEQTFHDLSIEIKSIPHYYFAEELKQAGEL